MLINIKETKGQKKGHIFDNKGKIMNMFFNTYAYNY